MVFTMSTPDENIWIFSTNFKEDTTTNSEDMHPSSITNSDVVAMEENNDLKPKTDYIKYIIQCSDLIRMWPRENLSKFQKFKHVSIVWLNFVYLTLFISSFVAQIVRFYTNMDGIARAVDHVTVYISGTFRYIYIYFKGEKYLKLVRMLRNDFIRKSLFDRSNSDDLQKVFTKAKYIIIGYNAPIIFWNLQMISMPVVHYAMAKIKNSFSNSGNATDVTFHVPIAAYFPLDITKSPGSVIFYLWETYGIVIVGIIYICVDDFWYMLILLTIGQFDVLKKSYETVMEFPQDQYSEKVELLNIKQEEELEKRMKKCLDHHSFLREFIHLMDDLLNPNVLVDYFHAIISIAFLLLEVTISIKGGNWASFSHSLQYLAVSVGHMFIFNWLANELAVKEEALADTICSLPWYKFPSQKHKILLTLIVSRDPFRLTGGRTFRLKLEFFTATLRVIFSYFTFLLQVRDQTGAALKELPHSNALAPSAM